MRTDVRSAGRRLRDLMEQGTVALPGAINALSARLIEQCGFDAYYLSGAVLSNSVVGLPDTGVATLTEAVAHATRCTAVTSIPAIMDADTGFGAAEDNARRTVEEYERAGLAGLHLEDQEFPKRCGHLAGKALVTQEEFCTRIAAAVSAKRDPDFVIIARTDARGVTSYDDAVERANAYAEAGADMIFPEALRGEEEFARFAQDVKIPLLANMTEFGQTPYLTVEQFASLGYKLVIFPVTLQRVAMKACQRALLEIKAQGTQAGLLDHMQTRQELYDLLGYEAVVGQPSGGGK